LFIKGVENTAHRGSLLPADDKFTLLRRRKCYLRGTSMRGVPFSLTQNTCEILILMLRDVLLYRIPAVEDFADNLFSYTVLPNWGMVYCCVGERNKETLKGSNNIGVDLYVESFDW